MRNNDSFPTPAGVLIALLTGCGLACGSHEPRTDAERLARGREIIDRMSAKLAATPAFSMTTTEIRDEVRSSGTPNQVTITRQTTVRRPDRLYSTVSGGRRTEVWYDGVGVTVVLHDEKIFGQIRAPETLDNTLDAMHERFGVSTPVADYVYSSPAKALLTKTTTGGWVAREALDGQQTDHLSFKDTGVNWDIWIPVSGDPLPRKAIAELTDDKRLRKIEVTFTNWDLAPQIPGDRFDPSVPADYEGVALIQRARVLRNLPDNDSSAATSGTDVKSGIKK